MQKKSKIFDQLSSALPIIRNWKENGYQLVFTNGCFDLVHSGHVQYLRSAKSLGDKLILGLNSDDSVFRLKGEGRPILNIEQRSQILEAFEMIDMIIVFEEDTPIHLIENILPHILVKGGDYTLDTIVGANVVLSNGGNVKALEFVEGLSTSEIIEKIRTIK